MDVDGGTGGRHRLEEPARAAHAMASRHEFMLTGSFEQEHTDGEGCAKLDSRRKGPTVPDNVELTVRLHSVSGEDVSVITRDFGGGAEALEAIGDALNERRSLTLTRARSNREAREHGVVINLAKVVFVWVYTTDNASVETGQYV
jgi:hypothetical protein